MGRPLNGQRFFDKEARDLDELVACIRDRGVTVYPHEVERAKHYLSYIGFYRLSGYMPPSGNEDEDDSNHYAEPPVSLESVLSLYSFDRKLRVIVTDAIERIEVAVRTVITETMARQFDPHWYLDDYHFRGHCDHERLLDYIEDAINFNPEYAHKRTKFIASYLDNYHKPDLPPSWMVFEVLSFRKVSQIYSWLQYEHQYNIAGNLGMHPYYLRSWIHSLVKVRNLCFHHARLWNQHFKVEPRPCYQYEDYLAPEFNNHFYAQVVVIQAFLRVINRNSKWSVRLKELFDAYDKVPISMMGFPSDWHQLPLFATKPDAVSEVV